MGRSCEAFTSDLAIKTIALPPYRYPDVSVICGEAQFEKMEGIAVLANPTLIIEVLSSKTEKRDRNEKRLACQAIPSVMEYLLIAQDSPHITHYIRQSDIWRRSDSGDLQASLVLPSIECVLNLKDVYVGVDFG